MPLLFGETDLIKSLQYLPGVSSGLEGTSGIIVRGGGADQNLILLDGVPVYNVSHLFGLFSVFNGDAINSATIYKGGFPARYSGRLSSVLDIRLKEGNMQEFHGSASIGLIAAKIMLEGPVIKDKTSFLFSARRTYADVLSYPIQYLVNKSNGMPGKNYYGYFFHDINAKINHKFSDCSRLYLSTYAGKDEFYNKDNNAIYDPSSGQSVESHYKYGFSWGNWTSSLRWNHIWSGSLFSNLTVSYSTFKHREYEEGQAYYTWDGLDTSAPILEDEYYSRVRDLAVGLDFNLKPFKNHDVRTGIKGNLYNFEPGTSINEHYFPELGKYTQRTGADTVRAGQWTAFLEDDFSIGKRFRANLGFNASLFMVEGKQYFSPEPRVSARYMLSDQLVLKASYSEMSQYLHLLTNAMVGLPTDSWVPSTSNLAPERSRQAAIGLNYKFRPGIRFSLEGFYKEMDNLVEYADGAEMQMNDIYWEDKVLTGNGTAYGLEFYAVKESGKLTGSLAYTLSKNTRQFSGINFGEPFPYKYDRRHDLSITANWQLKKNVSLGAVWVMASGINVTNQDHSYYNPLLLGDPAAGSGGFPVNLHSDQDLIRNFSERNGYKLPMYHRLDVGINFEKEKKRVDRTWSFGVYNLYSRKNAFYIYSYQGTFEDSQVEEKRVYQVTMLPFLPYVRYSIRF
jgi:outer membrane receptor for ferrienterochelin and colicin